MSPDRDGTLIFDGDCAFCTSAASWARRGFAGPSTTVAWQHLGDDGLAGFGLTAEQAGGAAWWVAGDGHLARGSRAVGEALRAGRGWRRPVGRLVLTPPLSWASAAAYRLVVRWRHRLPGATPACKVG